MAERDVIFLVGKEEYGLDVNGVTAIEPMMDIVPVPNAPACVLGLMNLRGEVIPVYSLRKRFEMEEFEDSAISDTPVIAKSARTAYVRAVANKQGKLVLLLEPSGLYEGDEEAQMEEVLKKMNSEEE